MDQQEKALRQALLIKGLVYNVASQLGPQEGFYNYWFKVLPRCSSHREAYEVVEVMYERIFKETRFRSYESFKVQKSKHFKKRRIC